MAQAQDSRQQKQAKDSKRVQSYEKGKMFQQTLSRRYQDVIKTLSRRYQDDNKRITRGMKGNNRCITRQVLHSTRLSQGCNKVKRRTTLVLNENASRQQQGYFIT